MSEAFDFYFNNPALRAGLFFIFGACIGSFITALVYRLPRKENWVSARSRCPSCNQTLQTLDLIPIISWLYLRGKCRYCRTGVPVRYPAIEILCGLIGVLISVKL